ncbi:hypothetical protein UFOVP147_8 [uncultured Caudovirales phage]|uniref:Uncharacterized protein n=1 Tax=uncultured Caudovirales phage TaxID=2100421 RepID=A0A6J7W1F5_9CAUD|nr:hypothetical protein UFOVP147_8 [uncultured Caudovirales phage]
MKLTIDIDLNTDSREQIAMVANLLNTVTNASRRPTSTQPQVVENSGSTGPVLDLSPGDSAVTGAAVPGAEPEPNAAPVVVKRTRRTKAEIEADAAKEAAAPVEKSAEPATETASTEPVAQAGSTAPTVTLDDVRTALQAFTAAKGVPAGIELLKEFGAARISELKAEQFSAFILKCGGAA